MILTLTNKDLELISEVMHSYKDHNRGNTEEVLRVMDFEKELTAKTCGAYEADTTYNVNIKRVKAIDIDWNWLGRIYMRTNRSCKCDRKRCKWSTSLYRSVISAFYFLCNGIYDPDSAFDK